MPWIQSEVNLSEHPKILRLMDELKIDTQKAVGAVHLLWHFTLKFAWKDGDLEKFGAVAVARGSRWDGDPEIFINALQISGFLDGLKVHDWLDCAGKYVADKIYNVEKRRNTAQYVEIRAKRDKRDNRDKIRESTHITDNGVSLEPEKPPDSKPAEPAPTVLTFPTVGSGPKEWGLTQKKIDEYTQSFPGVDILSESRKARQWCLDNPTKRKTARGMTAFLGRWLSSAQNRGSVNGGGNGNGNFAKSGPARIAGDSKPVPGKYAHLSDV